MLMQFHATAVTDMARMSIINKMDDNEPHIQPQYLSHLELIWIEFYFTQLIIN